MSIYRFARISFLALNLIPKVGTPGSIPGGAQPASYKVVYKDDLPNPSRRSSSKYLVGFLISGPHDSEFIFKSPHDYYAQFASEIETALNSGKLTWQDVEQLMEELDEYETKAPDPLGELLKTSSTYNKLVNRQLELAYKVTHESAEQSQFYAGHQGPLFTHTMAIHAQNKAASDAERLVFFVTVFTLNPEPQWQQLASGLRMGLNNRKIDFSEFERSTKTLFETLDIDNPTKPLIEQSDEYFHRTLLTNTHIVKALSLASCQSGIAAASRRKTSRTRQKPTTWRGQTPPKH
ncbi:hypothetical protein K2X33_02140 [bacterium]|nr:hypothetical protein [bacterium]